ETANAIAASQRATRSQGGSTQIGGSQSRPMRLMYVHDLLAVPGYTPEAVEKLREWVVILPQNTKININTAPAEVLAASSEGMSLTAAREIVNGRRSAHFRNTGDIRNRVAAGD